MQIYIERESERERKEKEAEREGEGEWIHNETHTGREASHTIYTRE